MTKYYRIDLYFGREWEVSKEEFDRKIKSKWYFPVWDGYYQEYSKNTYFDCRDSIVRVFYQRREVRE